MNRRPFRELREKMSPEAQERSRARAEEFLLAFDPERRCRPVWHSVDNPPNHGFEVWVFQPEVENDGAYGHVSIGRIMFNFVVPITWHDIYGNRLEGVTHWAFIDRPVPPYESYDPLLSAMRREVTREIDNEILEELREMVDEPKNPR